MSGAPPRLSVVVPVHDEADSVGPLIDEIATTLAKSAENYEMVFVDDGSLDATGDRLRACMALHPTLRVLTHERRSGQSTALRTGIERARGEWIATLDGDGQNDPADIPRLLERFAAADGEAVELVIGRRARRRDTWVRRASSRVANAVRSRVLGDDTPDSGCGLKVFRRELYLELPYFDHNHRFFPALVLRQGGRIASVDVNHRPRTAGRAHYGLANRAFTGLVDLAGVAWLMWRGTVPRAADD